MWRADPLADMTALAPRSLRALRRLRLRLAKDRAIGAAPVSRRRLK